jgi:hypothetical protein
MFVLCLVKRILNLKSILCVRSGRPVATGGVRPILSPAVRGGFSRRLQPDRTRQKLKLFIVWLKKQNYKTEPMATVKKPAFSYVHPTVAVAEAVEPTHVYGVFSSEQPTIKRMLGMYPSKKAAMHAFQFKFNAARTVFKMELGDIGWHSFVRIAEVTDR